MSLRLTPRLRALLVTAWTIGAVCLCAYLLLNALPAIDKALHTRPGDGVIDWLGARGYWEHVNPFSPEGLRHYNIEQYGFGHPPTTPFWFLPMTRWGVDMLGTVVGLMTLLLLILHLVIIAYDLPLPAPPATAALVFAAVLSTRWFYDHLVMAQISECIAFLYVLAWYFLRRGADVTGGAMLGLATTFKLFPGLLVLWLLLTRRWRAFAAACTAFMIIAVIMTARYGLVCWVQFFGMQKAIADKWVGDIQNASLQGIVLRCFFPTCGAPGHTLPLATIIAGVISLALIAGAWFLTRKAWRERSSRFDLAYVSIAMLSAFLNPWEWEHYYVLLLLPWLLLSVTLWRAVTIERLPLALGLLGFALLAAVVWVLKVDPHTKIAALMEYHGTHTHHARLHLLEILNWVPQLVLMGLSAWLLVRQSKRTERAALT